MADRNVAKGDGSRLHKNAGVKEVEARGTQPLTLIVTFSLDRQTVPGERGSDRVGKGEKSVRE